VRRLVLDEALRAKIAARLRADYARTQQDYPLG